MMFSWAVTFHIMSSLAAKRSGAKAYYQKVLKVPEISNNGGTAGKSVYIKRNTLILRRLE